MIQVMKCMQQRVSDKMFKIKRKEELEMKVVNENGSIATPQAGCVCSEGWKSTRGISGIILCNCNCTGYGDATFNANYKLAKNA